ncbi:MAG: tRNA pseudouridine(13) synthase TruD [Gammaproteobacteria bacterium]|nr:tRNA pseudouridine(13) synthase TruD [Gammaproteobacteria bacterium]
MSLPDWARAHGAPLYSASLRTQLDDFDVTEELGFDFSDNGEHDYLFIEKRGANTEWVSRQLATHAEVPARDVGYAGLKDRHAVTRQWFSVPRWNAADWNLLAVEGVRVLDQRRHNRKLKRGAHRANRFRIVMRGSAADVRVLDERLEIIRSAGVPNYFGEQRFGRGGSNIALADAWSQGRRLPRHKRSIAISSARSYLFNQILDRRVRDGTWNRLVPGDMANLDGSGSVFAVDTLGEDLVRRCDEMDIHPSGPLCGDGTPESALPTGHEEWVTALAAARVKPAVRSLRLRVLDLEWSMLDESLVLEFALSRGSFATAVLREIAEIHDARRQS